MTNLIRNPDSPLAEPTSVFDHLSALMSRAIGDANVRYANEHLVRCWEVKSCSKEDCPSYQNANLRCWQVAGTFCGGEVQGAFAQKYGNCKECSVFKAACATEMDMVGEHFNNMLYLLQEKIIRLACLNRELMHVESLMLQAMDNREVRYENKELIKCWVNKNCGDTECRAYGSDNLRCWQIVGTFSGDESTGKSGSCRDCPKCEVYKIACPTEVAAFGEQFNNMMHSLQRRKTRIENLNNELLHALDGLERKNRDILQLTITDTLTGLYNRSQLYERLRNEVELSRRYNRSLSLLVLDIDKFKSYNDSFGHPEGDLLLKQFGEILKASTRATDVACRFGGDEFFLIMPETEHAIAFVVAERIRNALKDHCFSLGRPDRDASVRITASIGIASFNRGDDTIDKLIERADQAMYQAKKEGRDKVAFL